MFLNEEKKFELDCFQGFKIPKKKLPEYVEYLENDEIKTILKALDISRYEEIRMRAFIELMLNTGLRPGEAISLNRDIVEKEEFEVIGKGNKKRLVYLNERTRYWLRQYLARRKDDREALFVSNRNSTERLAGRSMQQEFAKVIEEWLPCRLHSSPYGPQQARNHKDLLFISYAKRCWKRAA